MLLYEKPIHKIVNITFFITSGYLFGKDLDWLDIKCMSVHYGQ